MTRIKNRKIARQIAKIGDSPSSKAPTVEFAHTSRSPRIALSSCSLTF